MQPRQRLQATATAISPQREFRARPESSDSDSVSATSRISGRDFWGIAPSFPAHPPEPRAETLPHLAVLGRKPSTLQSEAGAVPQDLSPPRPKFHSPSQSKTPTNSLRHRSLVCLSVSVSISLLTWDSLFLWVRSPRAHAGTVQFAAPLATVSWAVSDSWGNRPAAPPALRPRAPGPRPSAPPPPPRPRNGVSTPAGRGV